MRTLGQKYMAPEEAEQGDATGAPAGEEASSEEATEFETFSEEFESSSYDDDGVEEGGDESETADAETDDSSHEDEGETEETVETEEDESEADEDESKEEETDEESDDDEEEEPAPEPMTEEQLTEARNQYIEQMAEQFQISDEDSDLLRTEPEKVMPKLLAKAMTQALEQSVSIMRDNLPKLVGSQLTQQSTAKEVESKFFGKYPELNSKKAVKVAERMAKAYRNANPKADMDEVMDNVAFMTWKQMKLPMDKLSERMNGTTQEEFRGSGKPQKTKNGFAPANPGRTGGEGRPAAAKAPASEFEEIANLMQNDSMFDD